MHGFSIRDCSYLDVWLLRFVTFLCSVLEVVGGRPYVSEIDLDFTEITTITLLFQPAAV